jgi:uncharacterized glyoxalase superfamily protein PhnB
MRRLSAAKVPDGNATTRYARLRDPFGHVWAFNAPVAAAKG